MSVLIEYRERLLCFGIEILAGYDITFLIDHGRHRGIHDTVADHRSIEIAHQDIHSHAALELAIVVIERSCTCDRQTSPVSVPVCIGISAFLSVPAETVPVGIKVIVVVILLARGQL